MCKSVILICLLLPLASFGAVLKHARAVQCGGDFTISPGSRVILETNNFPRSNYSEGQRCQWNIHCPERRNNRISMICPNFSLASTNGCTSGDRLVVSPLPTNLCGTDGEGTYETNVGFLRATFVSNSDGRTDKGFRCFARCFAKETEPPQSTTSASSTSSTDSSISSSDSSSSSTDSSTSSSDSSSSSTDSSTSSSDSSSSTDSSSSSSDSSSSSTDSSSSSSDSSSSTDSSTSSSDSSSSSTNLSSSSSDSSSSSTESSTSSSVSSSSLAQQEPQMTNTYLGCGSYDMTLGERLAIQSTDYPQNYPSSGERCQWEFNCGGIIDSQVRVKCPVFNLQESQDCTSDRLRISATGTSECGAQEELEETSPRGFLRLTFFSNSDNVTGRFRCYIFCEEKSSTS